MLHHLHISLLLNGLTDHSTGMRMLCKIPF